MSSMLTTVSRFKAYAGITGSTQDALILNLIASASAQIERYLRRTLAETTYKVWMDGPGAPVMRLMQYPITALYQVAVGNSSVAYLSNTTAWRATVSFDGTNLVLTEVSTAGVDTVTALAVASYKTIATLKDEEGVDVLGGLGGALSASTASSVLPGLPYNGGSATNTYLPFALNNILTLAVTNCGMSKAGKIILYTR